MFSVFLGSCRAILYVYTSSLRNALSQNMYLAQRVCYSFYFHVKRKPPREHRTMEECDNT